MTQDEIILQSEIERRGEARFYPTSSSMRPTINPRKDVCIIGPLPKKYLKLGTMVLYRRKDGFLTVNRVVHHASKTHTYRLCGDNRMHQERGITRSQMVGVVTAIESRRSGFRFRANGLPMRVSYANPYVVSCALAAVDSVSCLYGLQRDDRSVQEKQE